MTAPAHDARATRGAWAENAACRHLESHGLEPVARNYRCPHGEIDLVVRDGEELVFVEVRYRGAGAWVGGVESVDAAKRRRLLASAEHFLQRHREHAVSGCRFDVLGVSGAHGAPHFEWVRDAFGA